MKAICEKLRENLKEEAARWSGNPCDLKTALFTDLHPAPGCKSTYYLHEFDIYPDEKFLEVAYQVVLGRNPDPEGFNTYLEGLRSGHFTRDEVLGLLRFSTEGRTRKVNIARIKRNFWLSRARHLPFVGRFFDIAFGIVTLPRMMNLVERLNNLLETVNRTYRQNLIMIYEDLSGQINNICEQLEALKGRLKDHEKQLESNREQLKDREERLKLLFNRTATLRHAVVLLENKLSCSRGHDSDGDGKENEALSPFAYSFFEDDFRGDPEKVKDGFRPYISLVRSSPHTGDLPVLDLGCGRGEWLRLLGEEGIRAVGVDTSELALSVAAQGGLKVVKEDIFVFLDRSPPESFSVVTAFHLIEHLPPEKWLSLFRSVLRVLARGGIFIIETPNPRNILVASGDFYRDPSHIRPAFPDTLQFLGEIAGFVDSTVWFFDTNRERLIHASNVKFDTLQDYVNISRNFAWSGRKPT